MLQRTTNATKSLKMETCQKDLCYTYCVWHQHG
uniref:Uncharacterized protein n=1 Tax=Anguilla anguilla TaxID=7936 RepID=A0A0E9W8V5_ANGAN